MDNLCHTLTGAALAASGLGRKTRFGTAGLVIAANLPDIDVLAFLSDTPAVALRRGMTHGIVAQVLLPATLAAVLAGLDRWRPPPQPHAQRVRPATLFLLCYLAGLSHVGMDWLNNYGVRLLMPFSDRWFYGDAVFIVDPWLTLTLGAGYVLARRRHRPGPARAALAIASLYVFVMVASALHARQLVAAAWARDHGDQPAALLVGPVPINPLRKSVIVDAGDFYQRGTFEWFPAETRFAPARIPRSATHPAALAASRNNPDFRALLVWTRFPVYEIAPAPGGTRVTLSDMRFNERRIFTVSTVVPDQ